MSEGILYRRGTSSSSGIWNFEKFTRKNEHLSAQALLQILSDKAQDIHDSECPHGCSEHCRGIEYFACSQELAEVIIKEEKEEQKRYFDRTRREGELRGEIYKLKQNAATSKKLSNKEISMLEKAIDALIDGYEGTQAFTIKEMATYRKLRKKIGGVNK